MEIFQDTVPNEINLLSGNSILRPRRPGQLRMPGVAVNIDALVENLFAEPGLAGGEKTGGAAFVGAAWVDTRGKKGVGGPPLKGDRGSDRPKRPRFPRL